MATEILSATVALSDSAAEVAARVRRSLVQVRAGRGGIGSGVIWRTSAPDANGVVEAIVITNAHVVRAGRGTTFTLRLEDGREIESSLVAVDPSHDLASLKLRATGLVPAEIGDSQALRVGEIVVAVGNPFGREGAATLGVVAARAPVDPDIAVEPVEPAEPAEGSAPAPSQPRPDTPGRFGPWSLPRIDLIQADISLYPGNSGGPLSDARGRVMGINAMIGGGLAFAIPSWVVERFLAEADQAGTRVYLGVQVLTAPLTPSLRQRHALPQETVALVAVVEEGSPAQQAGMLAGDIVLSVDGIQIGDAEQLVRVLNRGQGERTRPRMLAMLRGGERMDLSLVPELRAAA